MTGAPKPAIDVSAAVRLAQAFKLKALHYPLLEARLVGELPTGPTELDWDLETVPVRWLIDEGELRVLLPFAIHITSGKGAGKAPLVDIRIAIRVDYDIAKEIPKPDEIDHFAGISGMMHAWPYLRAEVHALTNKLELLPLLLPLIVSGQVPGMVKVERLGPPNGAGARGPEKALPAKRLPKKRARRAS
jgi:hypothetical protein